MQHGVLLLSLGLPCEMKLWQFEEFHGILRTKLKSMGHEETLED